MTNPVRFFNKNILLMIMCQGMFLINNVTFISINGLVGFNLTPIPWMATLPVMGYVVGGALSTSLVAKTQSRYGRRRSFQIGILVAILSSLICAWAAWSGNFWLLVTGTFVAGYYSANGQLYRFAAPELVAANMREKAISWVLAGGLIGAVAGPNLASWSKDIMPVPFLGPYLVLTVVGFVALILMSFVEFPNEVKKTTKHDSGRALSEIVRQPVFVVALVSAALGYGIMNLLMAATPLAMDVCGFSFSAAAGVILWHFVGMFAPGFFTGTLIKRFGTIEIMWAGLILNALCIAIALSGVTYSHFWWSLLLLGLGWNFLFTASTNLAMQAYRPEEKDKAQAAINFGVFAVMAVSSFSSGALVTTHGWFWLNVGSILPVVIIAAGLLWLGVQRRQSKVQVV